MLLATTFFYIKKIVFFTISFQNIHYFAEILRQNHKMFFSLFLASTLSETGDKILKESSDINNTITNQTETINKTLSNENENQNVSNITNNSTLVTEHNSTSENTTNTTSIITDDEEEGEADIKKKEKLMAEKDIERIRRMHHMGDFDEDRPECIGNNSYPNRVGDKYICTCRNGYFGKEGDVNGTDCWTCKPFCHTLAKCVAENTCKCHDGLLGDGYSCYPPAPSIKNIITPSSGIHPIHVIVEYTEASSFEPYMAFCKFDELISGAQIFKNKSIACLQPQLSGTCHLSISFDGQHFSESQKYSYVSTLTAQKIDAQPFDFSKYSQLFAIISIVLTITAALIKFKGFFGSSKAIFRDPLGVPQVKAD